MIRRLGRRGCGGGRGTDGGGGAAAGAGLHLAVERRREGLDVGARVQALVLRNSNSEMGTAATKSSASTPNNPKRMAREARGGRGTSSSSRSFMMGSMARGARAGGARPPPRLARRLASPPASTNGRKRNPLCGQGWKDGRGRRRRPATFPEGAP